MKQGAEAPCENAWTRLNSAFAEPGSVADRANLVGDWPARGAGTSLINAAYVMLAQWLGPVQADARCRR